MQQVGESLHGLASRVGLAYDEAIGTACDKKALSALLAVSDLSFIACHGFFYEGRKEVAWVLAHKGGLPGQSGVLVKEDEQVLNHLSWREIERMGSTPGRTCSAPRIAVGP